jgi:hypothetical protein
MDIIGNKDIPASGFYKVALYINGVRIFFTIDDYVPCYFNNVEWVPAFASPAKDDWEAVIWPLILEKVWAKAHGSYEQTISGSNREAVLSLVGAPSVMIAFEKLEDLALWTKITEAFSKGYIMGCSSKA